MKREQILTRRQKEGFKKIVIEKLEELVSLRKDDLLERIKIAYLYSMGGYGSVTEEESLFLAQNGLKERRRVDRDEGEPLLTLFRHIFSPKSIKETVVPKKDFGRITDHYELEITDIQNLINNLKRNSPKDFDPSVEPFSPHRKYIE